MIHVFTVVYQIKGKHSQQQKSQIMVKVSH